MARYLKGWSSSRGTARHIITHDEWAIGAPNPRALCRAIIRLTSLDGFATATRKRLNALEVCDWCQAAKRRTKR